MEDYTKKIEEIVTEATTQKTFSLEVLGKIKDLKDGFDYLVKEDEHNREIIENYRITQDKSRMEILKLSEENLGLKAKEADVIKREKKQDINDLTLKNLEEQRNLILRMFETVFKNPTIQRSRFGSVPVVGNGYVNNGSTSETETETVNNN